MLNTRDKADAMDAMLQSGLLSDPTDPRSQVEQELGHLRDAHAVDAELLQLKAEMGQAPKSLEAPDKEPPALE
jgi:hypothetical protein